jgi:hypothetical protein
MSEETKFEDCACDEGDDKLRLKMPTLEGKYSFIKMARQDLIARGHFEAGVQASNEFLTRMSLRIWLSGQSLRKNTTHRLLDEHASAF